MKISNILLNKLASQFVFSGILILGLAGCSGTEETSGTPPPSGDPNKPTGPTACLQDFASLTAQVELASAIRGGRLYDKWWAEAGSTEPTTDHPLWDTRDRPTINTRTGADTWRCKECHGWDYEGVDGVYGDTANSHYTGFPSIMPAQNKNAIDVFCAIHSGTGIDADHNFSSDITNINILHLTKFLISADGDGLLDSSTVISANGSSNGSGTNGQTLYTGQDGCSSSNCHGTDGTAQHEPLGELSNDNPWEVLHKIRYGHPGAIMPAYADPNSTVQLSVTQIADVIAYTQTFDATPGGGGGGGGTNPPSGSDAEIIARGGRLYDNWISETGAPIPPVNNPTWALQAYSGGTNTRTGADTWRCKECHGWDYKGVFGVYGDPTNSHYTGFGGILDTEKTEEQIVSYLTTGFVHGATGATVHSFDSLIEPADMAALAKFIKQGMFDTSIYIGPSGIINGSPQNFQNGAALYAFEGFGVVNGNCELCHGADGREINFGSATAPEYLGNLANDNPWETLHKIRFGQPNSTMPDLISPVNILTGELAFDIQDAVDIVHYAQSLPQQ
jgi:mono/diheme cytochrome c family protein/ribosomal protein L37AE/L43A